MSTQKNDNLNIEDEGIKKAIEAIYKANGFNEEDVKYQYSPDENYVKESEIKENYYIFIERHSPDTDYEIWSDYNMLVNKETFEVYIYPAGGPLQNMKMKETLIMKMNTTLTRNHYIHIKKIGKKNVKQYTYHMDMNVQIVIHIKC